jgi:hypothetical protein
MCTMQHAMLVSFEKVYSENKTPENEKSTSMISLG